MLTSFSNYRTKLDCYYVVAKRSRRKPCCKLCVLVDDMVRDLKGLNMEPKPSTWTPEHHKRVVDAVTKLDALDVAKPMEKLAIAVLRVMEEERRQGLLWILTKHLRRLSDLREELKRPLLKQR
ncbi:hypothetical protein M0R45_037250 [Rubus argutus]|uniref:Uncharacterized protein n=1 Tax=Rubus argutus TaxID=59490 RepID=A0AAW1W3M7_RUBAR